MSGGEASAQFDHETFGEETKNGEKVDYDVWIFSSSDDEELLTELDDNDDKDEEKKTELLGADHNDDHASKILHDADDKESVELNEITVFAGEEVTMSRCLQRKLR